jgi:hypothetical protein
VQLRFHASDVLPVAAGAESLSGCFDPMGDYLPPYSTDATLKNWENADGR